MSVNLLPDTIRPSYVLEFHTHRAAAVAKRIPVTDLPIEWGQHLTIIWEPNEKVSKRIRQKKERELMKRVAAQLNSLRMSSHALAGENPELCEENLPSTSSAGFGSSAISRGPLQGASSFNVQQNSSALPLDFPGTSNGRASAPFQQQQVLFENWKNELKENVPSFPAGYFDNDTSSAFGNPNPFQTEQRDLMTFSPTPSLDRFLSAENAYDEASGFANPAFRNSSSPFHLSRQQDQPGPSRGQYLPGENAYDEASGFANPAFRNSSSLFHLSRQQDQPGPSRGQYLSGGIFPQVKAEGQLWATSAADYDILGLPPAPQMDQQPNAISTSLEPMGQSSSKPRPIRGVTMKSSPTRNLRF